ncbi:MAG: hypothetical protein SD837_16150 [Candidatus Electrothrix scaldis]|nr:MAG: hypothetical protein SD837_16150 [Candidatus Electrothrix sp. GW3-3]
MPGVETQGYFRQSLRDAVSLTVLEGRLRIAHRFNGGRSCSLVAKFSTSYG